jgi:GNAT superfamily N-acetyltransferase
MVRAMEPGDGPGLVALLQAMQAHYGVPCPPAERIAADLAALPPGVDLLVAADPAPVGFAAVGSLYPGPGLRPGLFLKELYVAREARGQGVGRSLLRAVARLALARGFARVDWTAARNDPALRAFYRATGAVEQEEKVFFRLTGDALADFAREEPEGAA